MSTFNIDSDLKGYIDEKGLGMFTKIINLTESLSSFGTAKANANSPQVAVTLTDTTLFVQSGKFCSNIVESGVTNINKNLIDVCQLSLVKDYCKAELQETWMGLNDVKGTDWTDLGAFTKWFTDEFTTAAQVEFERLAWHGNGIAGQDCVLGLYYQLSANTSRVDVSGYTSITVSNVEDAVDAMAENLPVGLRKRKDLALFMSNVNIGKLYTALKAANYVMSQFYIDDASGKLWYASNGFKFELIGVSELDGTSQMYLTFKENLIKVYSNSDILTNIEWMPASYPYRTSHLVLDTYFGVGFIMADYIVTNF
jgi:hypothetical protein